MVLVPASIGSAIPISWFPANGSCEDGDGGSIQSHLPARGTQGHASASSSRPLPGVVWGHSSQAACLSTPLHHGTFSSLEVARGQPKSLVGWTEMLDGPDLSLEPYFDHPWYNL